MSSYTENVNTDIDIKITNPGFDGGADWLPDDEWVVAGGVATLTMTLGQFNQLGQLLPALVVGNWYDITFDLLNAIFSAGNGIHIKFATSPKSSFVSTNGKHTLRAQYLTGSKLLNFENETFDFPNSCDIDNVLIEAVGTDFFEDLGIDHRPIRGALRYSVPDGDRIYHALSYKDKTNCMIKFTP